MKLVNRKDEEARCILTFPLKKRLIVIFFAQIKKL